MRMQKTHCALDAGSARAATVEVQQFRPPFGGLNALQLPCQFEQGAEMGRDLALLFGRLILEPADDVKQAAAAGLIRVFAEHQLIS